MVNDIQEYLVTFGCRLRLKLLGYRLNSLKRLMDSVYIENLEYLVERRKNLTPTLYRLSDNYYQ